MTDALAKRLGEEGVSAESLLISADFHFFEYYRIPQSIPCQRPTSYSSVNPRFANGSCKSATLEVRTTYIIAIIGYDRSSYHGMADGSLSTIGNYTLTMFLAEHFIISTSGTDRDQVFSPGREPGLGA